MQRIIKALGYSLDGLKASFQTEAALRQELLLCIILLPVVYLLNVSATSKALIIVSMFLIIIAELANTAIEVIINRISEDLHPLSKKAKDIGSAMVLLAFINAFCVWGIILLDT